MLHIYLHGCYEILHVYQYVIQVDGGSTSNLKAPNRSSWVYSCCSRGFAVAPWFRQAVKTQAKKNLNQEAGLSSGRLLSGCEDLPLCINLLSISRSIMDSTVTWQLVSLCPLVVTLSLAILWLSAVSPLATRKEHLSKMVCADHECNEPTGFKASWRQTLGHHGGFRPHCRITLWWCPWCWAGSATVAWAKMVSFPLFSVTCSINRHATIGGYFESRVSPWICVTSTWSFTRIGEVWECHHFTGNLKGFG